MKLEKIVLTGGPCAGKTSVMEYVREKIGALGYKVILVPETATEMKCGGVTPWECAPGVFQRSRLELQMKKEEIFERAARSMSDDKVLIVCDRGALDTRCYTTSEQFAAFAREIGSSEVMLRDSYGAVFHLESAAKGARGSYVTGEGTVRTESADVSAEHDDRLISAWCGHPHYRVIGCEENFSDKADHLVREIASFLGEPKPLEIERKFLIKYPDIGALSCDPFCKKVEIEQTYILYGSGGARVRRRGANGDYIYVLTQKRDISDTVREEREERITKEEYERLLQFADPERKTIKKDRYCLVYKKKYFEIDVYPFWSDRAIMEIELSDDSEGFEIPEMIEVIREVTGEAEYKNYALAGAIPMAEEK